MAGARVLYELGETDDRSRAELTALMGAVFGVVTSSFHSTTTDGDAADVVEELLGGPLADLEFAPPRAHPA